MEGLENSVKKSPCIGKRRDISAASDWSIININKEAIKIKAEKGGVYMNEVLSQDVIAECLYLID